MANWRVATIATQTVDEYGVLFRNLFAMEKIEVKGIGGIVISSVVPPLDSTLRQVCERYFNTKPLFIEPGVKTGMPVLYENPAEVGADRIVNSVAAPIRATAIGINLFIIHLFGDAFSPALIGAISDRSSLRLGFSVTLVAMVVSAGILFMGTRFAPPRTQERELVGASA